MVGSLRNAGVDEKDIKVVVNLYWEQRTKVRLDRQYISSIQIQ